MEIKVKSTDSKHYEIYTNDRLIGDLIYPKWYSYDAQVCYKTKTYDIKPVGFWHSKIVLNDGTETLISFRMTWKGGLEIKDLSSMKTYLVNSKGIINRIFYLYDEEERILLSLKDDSKWTKFSNDYSLNSFENFEKYKNFDLLLFSVVYALNYYKAAETSVVV